MFVDNYCGSYKIIAGTLKKLLKTQSFGIKAILLVNKILWPFFNGINDHDKRQGTL